LIYGNILATKSLRHKEGVQVSSLRPACHCKSRAGRSQLEWWNNGM